jgi:hypothetical protein
MADSKFPKTPTLYTPVGVAIYPHLLTPDTKFIGSSGIPAYKCKLRLEDNEELAAFRAQAEAFFKGCYDAFIEANPKFKRTAKVKYEAFRQVVGDDGEFTGEIEIVTKLNSQFKDKKTGKVSNQRPKLVDAKNRECVPASIWGGSKLRLAVRPLFTNQGAEITYAWRLVAVQIIELVKGGGGAGVNFGEADGYDAGDDEEASFGPPAAAAAASTDEPSGDAGNEDEEF